MKISLLQQREPFEEILEKTLTAYLNRKVKWQNNKKNGNWLVNSHLNAIFAPNADKTIFSQITKEFSHSVIWWKRPLQKLYVLLATNSFTAKFFATASLCIEPQIDNAKNILIIGGNHHLRILNYKKIRAFVINKSGFNKQFLINEIKLRQANPSLPIPKLFEVADDNSWYSEEIISGTPLNRMNNGSQAKDSLKKIKQSLAELHNQTKEQIPVKLYTADLSRKIIHLAENNDFLDEQQIQKINQQLLEKINSLAGQNNQFIICQTHGDFQPANILVEKEKVWLIDWEYTGLRQIDFDSFVYDLNSRSPLDFQERFIKQFREQNSNSEAELKLLVFLLEELQLRLEEVDNPLFKSSDLGLKTYLNELEKIIHFLFDESEVIM